MALNLSALTDIKTKSGVQIDKIVTKNGVVLWSRSTPYYAIQNGTVVDCPNVSVGCIGGYANAYETITSGNHTFFGASSHSGSPHEDYDYENCVCDTGSMDTKKCKYMSVTAFLHEWGYDVWKPSITIWGDGNQILFEYAINDGNSQTWTLDVSAYSTIRVRCEAKCSAEGDRDVWMAAGIENLRFYN